MPARAAWSPADYLLHGRYCETEVMQAALDDICAATASECALLLAFRAAGDDSEPGRAATPFRSLLLFSHRDREVAEREGKHLSRPIDPAQRVNFDPAHEDLAWVLERLAVWAPPTAPYLQRRVSVLERRPEPELNATHGVVPAHFRILLFDAPALVHEDTVAARLDDLLYMVNASAPVVVHGNLAGERDVDAEMRRLDRAEKASNDRARSVWGRERQALSPDDDPPQVLLDAALRLTRCSAGNVYVATSDQRLRLIAQRRNANPLSELDRDDSRSVVAWVYRRERPMVLNDIRDFHRSVLPEGEDAYAELAVPIVQSRPGTGGSPVIGVINVEKVRGLDAGHFTYRDLTVMRLIANRFSAGRSQSLISSFSRSLVGLAQRHSIAFSEIVEDEHVAVPSPAPPIDALPALPTIDEMLEGIHEITRSHSATVRLLSNDLRHLVRFSAFPADRMNDVDSAIGIRHRKSVNAWVVRNGRPCYLASPEDRDAYEGLDGMLNVRPKTVSELCEPIYVGGRIVGSMNLESRYRAGYEDLRDAARMVAGQIGLALQHARRALEQEVFSMTIAATANLHEIFKCTAELRKVYGGEEGERLAEAIELLVDPPTASSSDAASQTTQEVLEKAIRTRHLERIFALPAEPTVTMRHAGTTRNILQIAFEELLRNARYFTSDEEACRLYWNEQQWAGQRYLTLSVHNPISRSVTPTRVACLFRTPLRYGRTARAHIGAFTAGALMRSLGGDIYVSSSDPPTFVANLQLPVNGVTD